MQALGWIAEVEVLRGVAILMVLFEHINFLLFYWHSGVQDFNTGYWRGGVGVNLFFTISGFVIARGLVTRLLACRCRSEFAGEVRRFLIQRFWRLQPAAWVWLCAPLILCIAYNRSGAFLSPPQDFSSSFAGLLGVANLRLGALGEGAVPGMAFHYWSLSLEEQFYLLLPLLVFCVRGGLGAVMLGLFALQFAMPDTLAFAAVQPGALAVGVLLAIWEAHPAYGLAEPRFLGRSPVFRSSFLIVLACLLGMALSELRRPLSASLMYGVCSVLTGAIVYAASFGRGYIMADNLIRRGLIWLGSRSYSVYLAHVCAYAAARETMFRLHPLGAPPGTAESAAYLVLAACLTLIWAEMSYRLVESPARRYGRRMAQG